MAKSNFRMDGTWSISPRRAMLCAPETPRQAMARSERHSLPFSFGNYFWQTLGPAEFKRPSPLFEAQRNLAVSDNPHDPIAANSQHLNQAVAVNVRDDWLSGGVNAPDLTTVLSTYGVDLAVPPREQEFHGTVAIHVRCNDVAGHRCFDLPLVRSIRGVETKQSAVEDGHANFQFAIAIEVADRPQTVGAFIVVVKFRPERFAVCPNGGIRAARPGS